MNGPAPVFPAGPLPATARIRAAWVRHRFWILVGTIVLAVALGGYLASVLGGRSGATLAIDNPAPSGARATATILGRHGVHVTATASLQDTLARLDALPEDSPPPAATVLVYDPLALLTTEQGAALTARAAVHGARIVAVSPGPRLVSGLGADFEPAGTAGTPKAVAAECANPDARAAGTIDAAGLTGTDAFAGADPPALLYSGAVTCFPVPVHGDGNGKHSATPGTAGLLATDGTGAVAVLGNPAVLSNERLAVAGNAALTLRLLGGAPELIWYTASPRDLPTGSQEPTLAELTPRWILPAGLWLGAVAVLGMLWKGRRLGPPVIEPLPVVVPAAETTTGRARLYADARAAGAAGRLLRGATVARLARRLRLGAGATAQDVVAALTRQGTRPPEELARLLTGPEPRNGKELPALGVQLDALEEVERNR